MPDVKEIVSDERNVYELGYHLVPTIGESALPEEVSSLKGLIERHGGIFIMEEYPVLTPLAYTVEKVHTGKRDKHNTAYFGWVKFELESGQALPLKEELDLKETVLRFLLIRTVREDTRVPKRVFAKPEVAPTKAAAKTAEKTAPISEEELDRSIAELVVE